MKQTFIFVILLFAFADLYSQGEDNSLKGVSPKQRIVTGGGFGLQFGTNQDFFSVSPVLGYMLTKKLMAGTGVTYRYTNNKLYKVKLNDYGLNPFVRFTVYRNIFIQTEFEHLNYEFPTVITSTGVETSRRSFNSFMGGGGFVQPIGGKVYLYLMAMYNFSYKPPTASQVYSVYDSPLIIRGGINIGNFGIY